MRKILLIAIFIIHVSVLSALKMDQITIGLVPYDAGSDVDLKSTEFPVRSGSSIEYKDFSESLDLENSSTYSDPHMVASGGIFGIPGKGAAVQYEGQWGHIYYESLNPLEVYIQCPSDFNYVSQSHSEFVRPFRLYVVERYGESSEPYNVAGHGQGVSFSEINPGEVRSFVEYELTSNSNTYNNMWFDLILALPWDMPDGINSTGVVIDNVVYPLIAEDDYTASIFITISWRQPYTIYYDKGGYVSDEFRYQKTLTIPFSGHVGTYDGRESEISFSISRLPGASNINLNSGHTGVTNQTDVARIDLLVNFPKEVVPTTNRDKVRIFLSSSAEAGSPSAEFRLVHEDYSSREAGENNSFRYLAVVRSTEGQAQTVEFDGTGYMEPNGNIPDNKYLSTDCHNENQILQTGTDYYHFHSFSGIVSVVVLNENDSKTMLAGRYESRIYVHVVVDE